MTNLEGNGRRATGRREKSGRGEPKREKERERQRERNGTPRGGRHTPAPPFCIVLFGCCVPCSGRIPWY